MEKKGSQKSNRVRIISMIHLQKNAAHLTDDEYRLILSGATGKQSCNDCSFSELQHVFNDLNAVLEHKGLRQFYFKFNQDSSLKDAVYTRAEKVLGENYRIRLTGLLARMKVNSIESCTEKQLRAVMGMLSRIEKGKKNEKTAGTVQQV